MDKILTLGIETSCDETAASVLRGGRLLLKSNQTVDAIDRPTYQTKSPRSYATLHFASIIITRKNFYG